MTNLKPTDELDQYEKQEEYNGVAHFIDKSCPKCGAKMLSDNIDEYCSDIGCAYLVRIKDQEPDQPIKSWEWEKEFDGLELRTTHSRPPYEIVIRRKEAKDFIRSNFVPKQELIKKLEGIPCRLDHHEDYPDECCHGETISACIEAIKQM